MHRTVVPVTPYGFAVGDRVAVGRLTGTVSQVKTVGSHTRLVAVLLDGWTMKRTYYPHQIRRIG